MHQEGIRGDAIELRASADRTTDALFELSDRAMMELDRLISVRVSRLTAARNATLAAIAAGMLLLAMVGLGVVRALTEML
jgi:hypothetical protein